MQKEINLLPKRQVDFLQKESTSVGFRIIMVFSVIIVVCSFIIIFFLQRNYSVDAIQTQQAAITAKLSPLHGKIVQELTLNDRAKKITTILKTRAQLVNKMNLIQKQLPQDVAIDTLEISKTDVSLSVTSRSLTSLQKFIDALTDLVTQKKLLQKITIDNIMINQQSGTYSVTIRGILL